MFNDSITSYRFAFHAKTLLPLSVEMMFFAVSFALTKLWCHQRGEVDRGSPRKKATDSNI